MIRYKNFTAWYPDKSTKKEVIHPSDFTLYPHKITALTGLNGVGKTTLIKSILGLSPFCDGTLYFNEAKTEFLNLPRISEIGYSPEISSSSENYTPEEFIKYNNLLSTNVVSSSSDLSIHKIFETFDLLDYLNVPFSKLSKGTRKRVLNANALLNEPSIIILDEPFEGLDQNQRIKLKELLIEHKKRSTILISSHELLELNSFCDLSFEIKNGWIEVN